MRQEAETILGTHDFAAFAAAASIAKTTVRTMHAVAVWRENEQVILRVHGNAFLYNMVRILAGTLIDVGMGRLPVGTIARALETGDRLTLGVTAPAHGLTLLRVFYGDDADAQAYFSDRT